MACRDIFLKSCVVLLLLLLVQESEQHWGDLVVHTTGHDFAYVFSVDDRCLGRGFIAPRTRGRVSTVE
jgi:hypothetical protein